MIQRYQECRKPIEEIWDRGSVAYVNLKAYIGNISTASMMEIPFPVMEALKHLMAIYDPEEYSRWFVAKVETAK